MVCLRFYSLFTALPIVKILYCISCTSFTIRKINNGFDCNQTAEKYLGIFFKHYTFKNIS